MSDGQWRRNSVISDNGSSLLNKKRESFRICGDLLRKFNRERSKCSMRFSNISRAGAEIVLSILSVPEDVTLLRFVYPVTIKVFRKGRLILGE